MKRTCAIRRDEMPDKQKSPFTKDDAKNLILPNTGKFGIEFIVQILLYTQAYKSIVV